MIEFREETLDLRIFYSDYFKLLELLGKKQLSQNNLTDFFNIDISEIGYVLLVSNNKADHLVHILADAGFIEVSGKCARLTQNGFRALESIKPKVSI